jgi:hypothetical protein
MEMQARYYVISRVSFTRINVLWHSFTSDRLSYVSVTWELVANKHAAELIVHIGTLHAPPNPRLHNSRTNWCIYRATLQEAIQLNKRLKSSDDVEAATHDRISLLQEATSYSPRGPLKKTLQTYHWKLRSYWPKNAKHELNGEEAMPLLIK